MDSVLWSHTHPLNNKLHLNSLILQFLCPQIWILSLILVRTRKQWLEAPSSHSSLGIWELPGLHLPVTLSQLIHRKVVNCPNLSASFISMSEANSPSSIQTHSCFSHHCLLMYGGGGGGKGIPLQSLSILTSRREDRVTLVWEALARGYEHQETV